MIFTLHIFLHSQKNIARKYLRQFTVFTAYTEHDSTTINTITYTCFNRINEFNY